MSEVLKKYLPEHAVLPVFELIKMNGVHLKIVNERKTRHGDYSKDKNGQHQITVNASLNKYRFLITTIHEIAHLVAFKKYGQFIKPHGLEWKHTFQQLMVPFLIPAVFPNDILPLLFRHFNNPTASSDTDAKLSIAIKSYDEGEAKTLIYEVPLGSIFSIKGGRIFKKGVLRVKRFECTEISSGKAYLFKPNAEVQLIK
ncbi:MAG: SprT-like domain-containing protein [Flavobacterium sp.]